MYIYNFYNYLCYLINMSKKNLVFIFFLSACFSQINYSIAKADYNLLGQQGHSAWECAIYADYGKLPAEQNRLFKIGYQSLYVFIRDGVEGKIDKSEYKNVPIMVLWQFTSGPTVDFRLGQIWATMLKFHGSEISESVKYSDGTESSAAKKKFINKNCQEIK